VPSSPSREFQLQDAGTHWVITYEAMASPCEVLVRCRDAGEARQLASLASGETRRIERKFSRYRDDSVVHSINHSNGRPVAVDEETSRLLHYAGQCHALSHGRFDITSGILRRAWTFDGRTLTPDPEHIASLLEHVGWTRVRLEGATVRLPHGMEIDLGGIGKEYAADRVAALLASTTDAAVLVNLGGDLRALGGGRDAHPWTVGIQAPFLEQAAVGQIDLAEAGVATSGDSRRFCIVAGTRLGHILDPRTGWPVAGAPHSVTVVADTCTAAGFLATMAMLHGPDAETFLQAQEVPHHCIR